MYRNSWKAQRESGSSRAFPVYFVVCWITGLLKYSHNLVKFSRFVQEVALCKCRAQWLACHWEEIHTHKKKSYNWVTWLYYRIVFLGKDISLVDTGFPHLIISFDTWVLQRQKKNAFSSFLLQKQIRTKSESSLGHTFYLPQSDCERHSLVENNTYA